MWTKKKFQLKLTQTSNLFEAVYSTKLVKDRRLRIDMTQIQEAIREENIELLWIPGNEMLADILTKKGVSADSILEVIRNGRLERKNAKRRLVFDDVFG